jgi:hypothetical protein
MLTEEVRPQHELPTIGGGRVAAEARATKRTGLQGHHAATELARARSGHLDPLGRPERGGQDDTPRRAAPVMVRAKSRRKRARAAATSSARPARAAQQL